MSTDWNSLANAASQSRVVQPTPPDVLAHIMEQQAAATTSTPAMPSNYICECCQEYSPDTAQGSPNATAASSYFMWSPQATRRPSLCPTCWTVMEQHYLQQLAAQPLDTGKTRGQAIQDLFTYLTPPTP